MACVLIGMSAALRLSAHPLPNTKIVVSLNDGGVRLDIALPVPELRLALPASFPNDGNLLGESQQRALRAYFHEHLSLVSRNGTPQPHVAESISVSQSVDANVGQYQELRVRVWAPATEQFNPRDFTLAYDAIIHQVPNHFAIVKVAHDFRGGVLAGERAADIGMIRYDFARNEVGPLHISAAPAGLWSGFRSAIRLGFHHVATGLDHVLFLATLLVVAPLRVADGRWSLFQGWRYAVRRFLGISVAFIVGHSIALLVGAYGFVPVPLRVVEILIAGSILVAAVHAIRPLFSGREWLVAAAFGTVHGLAFSESLVGLNLTAVLRGVAVLGFNLGVESAQLVVMAAAVPLLIVSHWRVFHALRITLMVCTALLAVVWMLERAREPAVATTSHSNPVSDRSAVGRVPNNRTALAITNSDTSLSTAIRRPEPFAMTDGNCQGYARQRTIAVSPIAELPEKTRFHELAHVVLGHTLEAAAGWADSEMTPRSLREVEAEAVALFCLEALGLPGADHCRGYIQHWARGADPIPERSATRIFKAADQILKSGAQPIAATKGEDDNDYADER